MNALFGASPIALSRLALSLCTSATAWRHLSPARPFCSSERPCGDAYVEGGAMTPIVVALIIAFIALSLDRGTVPGDGAA